jgi:hypothetical protein
MSLQTRINKIESRIPVADDNLCDCADAVALIATPYAEVCFRCGREIKTALWRSWRVVHPSEAMMFFAFAMRRDDGDLLTDKPNEFFLDEIKIMLDSEI